MLFCLKKVVFLEECKSFVLYTAYREPLSRLTDVQLGQVFRAILDFAAGDGNVCCIDPEADIALSFILADLQRNREKWEDVRRKRQAAADVRWNKKKNPQPAD